MKGRIGSSLLLFALAVLVYAANGRAIGAGDTLPARYLPFSILRHGTFTLDAFPVLYGEEAKAVYPLLDGVPYYLRYRDGHYLSAYSPGPAILAVPLYVFPVLAGMSPGSPWFEHLEKAAAVLVTALSVVFLFWAASLLVSRRWALVIAVVYAFGTSSLSASSQGLWQQGPSQLFFSLAVYWLARGLHDERYLGHVGFALGAAMVMRATNLLIVLPLAAWILYRHRSVTTRFIVFGLAPVAALGLYTLVAFGPAGAGWGHATVSLLAFFSQVPFLEGLAGLLVSPSRGLFVYSPVLVFSVLGTVAVWRNGPPLLRALSLGPVLVLLLLSKWFMWWGGHTFGPRILADATPILAFLLCPVTGYLDRHGLAKVLFFVCAAVSIVVHGLGAFFYDGRWDSLAKVDSDYSALWSWRRSQLGFYAERVLKDFRVVAGTIGDGANSADSPTLLAATYVLEPPPSPLVYAGEDFPVVLTARNTGSAAWLAAAPDDRGTVKLGWRWYNGDREVLGGRAGLRSDVPPGGGVRIDASVTPPGLAGDYTISFDLVSESLTWFGAHGTKPATVGVLVRDLDPARLLTRGVEPLAASPTAAVAIDRASYRTGDALNLTIALSNPHRPRSFDAYLALQGPNEAIWFYDGYRLYPSTQTPWQAWAKRLPLPGRLTGRFQPPTASLAPGRYAWHLILTEAGSYRPRARATVAFMIAP